jgi:hypothetical protein
MDESSLNGKCVARIQESAAHAAHVQDMQENGRDRICHKFDSEKNETPSSPDSFDAEYPKPAIYSISVMSPARSVSQDLPEKGNYFSAVSREVRSNNNT